eukprot:6211193-Pleurochrysis_carterae.AAC.2
MSFQSTGAPPANMPAAWQASCAGNIDLEWLFHFLFDYAFLYWDLRQAVRSNQSNPIDLV